MKISILVATYKGVARIKTLLKSMIANGFNDEKDIELLIFDDGSPQEDFQELNRIIFDIDIKCIVQRVEHGGWISTINALVRESTGDIVLLLDDDVLFVKDLLSTLRQLISIDNIGVLSWRSYGNNPGQSKIPRIGFVEPATQLAGYCMAFKRNIWNELNGFDQSFKVYCSDSDFVLRATLAGHPSYRVWWPLIPHEEHKCFDNAPELERQKTIEYDLANFTKKWGMSGQAMEQIALQKLIKE